jgi:hypothetical protein
VYQRYVGTSPPLNSIVINTNIENTFLAGKSFLESGYAIRDVMKTLAVVPIAVTKIVMP